MDNPRAFIQDLIKSGEYVSPSATWYDYKDQFPRIYGRKTIEMICRQEVNK